jgi:hypothetical protein
MAEEVAGSRKAEGQSAPVIPADPPVAERKTVVDATATATATATAAPSGDAALLASAVQRYGEEVVKRIALEKVLTEVSTKLDAAVTLVNECIGVGHRHSIGGCHRAPRSCVRLCVCVRMRVYRRVSRATSVATPGPVTG